MSEKIAKQAKRMDALTKSASSKKSDAYYVLLFLQNLKMASDSSSIHQVPQCGFFSGFIPEFSRECLSHCGSAKTISAL